MGLIGMSVSHGYLFAYRTKCYSMTQESPFFLLYGQDTRTPMEEALAITKSLYLVDMSLYLVDIHDYMTELINDKPNCNMEDCSRQC